MSMQSTVSLGRVGRVLGGEKLASRSGSKENVSRATTPEVKTPSSAKAPVTLVPIVVNCHEPDVVASAKASIQTDSPSVENVVDNTTRPSFEPVAPPRRRRNKAQAPIPPSNAIPVAPPTLPDPPAPPSLISTAPAVIPVSISAPMLSTQVLSPPLVVEPSKKTIHSLTRGFDFSLDLMSATKGNYVIKPQASVAA